ncbi:MAG: hypothetical protein K8R36_21815, partial [Planctomycetales bacterium]|nr:hypothetical protein [Planctomycetales bacterium]
TLELKTPRGEEAIAIHAAAHIQSSNPPSPDVKYAIEYSLDGGKSWMPVVKDWQITRRGGEPGDFWSQSLCWGSTKLKQSGGKPVQIRFRNDGGKNIARAEAHLVYRTVRRDSTQISFVWKDEGGEHADRRTFSTSDLDLGAVWKLPTGRGTVTKWVGLEPVPAQ